MKCPNCGNELPRKAMFCGSCGIKIEADANDIKTPKTNLIKTLLIVGGIIAITLIAIVVISILSKNTKADSDLSSSPISKETMQIETVSAEEFFRSELCKGYYGAINTTTETLHYRFEKGERQFDCSDFVDLILDHYIVDFDGDGKEDIIMFTLEVADRESLSEDQYGEILLYTRVYLAEGSSFKLYSENSTSFNDMMSDYIKSGFNINVVNCSDNTCRIVQYEWLEDGRKLYGDEKPYYTPEESMGDFADTARIYSFSDAGLCEDLVIHRSVTHHKGMPEAESHSYFTAKNGSGYNTLFIGGITKVITISGVDYPTLEEEISGEYDSESEACDAINSELDTLGLKSYHLGTFKRDDRLSGYLTEPGDNPCCLNMTIDETNDSSGKLIIKVKKS